MSRQTPGPDGAAVVCDIQMREFLDGPSCTARNCSVQADAQRQQRTRFLMHAVGLCIAFVAIAGMLSMTGIPAPNLGSAAPVLVGISLGLLAWRVFMGSGSRHKAQFVLAVVAVTVASMIVMSALG